jgi:hypothetical protein
LFGVYIYNNMQHIKLKTLISEQHKDTSPLAHLLEKDLTYLQERLIEEGLWDTIKQKVGGALEKTGEKAKEILVKPLIKVVLDKIAKDDPEGFAKLQQHAQKDPQNIKKLLDHPDIKKQQDKIEKELGNIQENLTEEQAEDFLQEYMDAVLEEARVLRDDPRNIKRRERYAQRKAERSKQKKPAAGDNIKQGAKQLGKGLGQAADKIGIKAIEKGGDFIKGAADLAKKGLDTQVGQAAKGAVGGLIGKVYGWVKKNPKLSAGIGLGLLGAIFAAASIGSGGIVPLITSTLAAAGGGALKGGAIGGTIGAAKDAYSQIKGGAKSFKDMDYKQLGKSALKTGAKGAAIGAAVGAGANVLGKAALGAKDIASGEYSKAIKGFGPNNDFRDLTPGEKRAYGVNDTAYAPKMSDSQWAKQYNPDDMSTWKVKPRIKSSLGYQVAREENEALFNAIKKVGTDSRGMLKTGTYSTK